MQPEIISRAGRAFFAATMELGKRKAHTSAEYLCDQLNSLIETFLYATSLSNLDVRIEFCDVHALMGRRWHTELAYVRVQQGRIHLAFHHLLLTHSEPYAGFIFIAKCWVILLVLSKTLERRPDLISSFVFEIGDGASMDHVGYTSTHKDACLILDYDFASSGGYAQFRETCESNPIAWNERAQRVFWRGSTTGVRLSTPPDSDSQDDFRWLQRLDLCLRAKRPPLEGLCDVGVTQVVQIFEENLAARIHAAGLVRAAVSREHFMQYRGVFDIDGNANAWSGLFCTLLGGSCVLKVASPTGHHQWYYDELTPWLHYIPISADLSDLSRQLQWFRDHSDHSKEIARRGAEFANYMTYERSIIKSADNLLHWIDKAARGQERYASLRL
jgi:hypothetical protein